MVGLELFPDTASVDGGELGVGGVAASELAREFGTPLVVYCEETIRARARAYRRAAPEALVVYGTKAFPNVAVMRLLAEEGIGADVSTLGELRFAEAAGVPPERLVVHGNNKSDEELRAAAEAGAAYVVLDSVEELERARAAGVERMLARITPGIEAETHEAIRTGHVGSKFGMSPEEALGIRDALAGLHVHIGSQLLSTAGAQQTLEWLNRFLAESGWEPDVVDLGGGLGVPTHPSENAPSIAELVGLLVGGLDDERAPDPGARPLARRPGGSDAVPRRLGQASGGEDVGGRRRRPLGQSAPAVVRRAVHGLLATPAQDRHRAHGRDRRPALRVRGCADRRGRASGAAPRRPARSSRDRGVHALDGLQLQRRSATGCRARRGRRTRG